jgi:hypothetical protein
MQDSAMFDQVLPSASVSTRDVILKFKANKHPPLTTSLYILLAYHTMVWYST